MRSEHLRWTGVCCALLAVLLTGLVAARWGPLLSYDDQVARNLHASAVTHPGVTHLMRVLTDWVWDPLTMRGLGAAACVWLWLRGDRRRARRIAAAVVMALAVQHGLKALVGRERPVWPDPVDSAHFAAYPSGHAMTAATVCALMLWLLPRRAPAGLVGTAWALAAVSVLGVGFTRLYLGVHWFSDVLGGWLLGMALAALAIGFRCACSGRSPASPRADHPVR
ncbi:MULTISPECIES: phosphatase PAP2 family protein [unclassified Streptomyces]|uniref:phosphatase PAP2 family protein n=1 Tax=unclassified Streptomyces TaxID=2593676 RepID=UPI001BEC42D8|nr:MULTISPECIES: phosphatase PAP2 family protein [unclassified Streptomyces]MBT2407783.1 phosphatase PAP2 family protein [Streptomyces sp. ISL-21]MBT2613788.1 phosphatase PAP2 family protein [Streptomyces sp. ISL-87]